MDQGTEKGLRQALFSTMLQNVMMRNLLKSEDYQASERVLKFMEKRLD